eukprot:1928988-Rhodomonas_salina.4
MRAPADTRPPFWYKNAVSVLVQNTSSGPVQHAASVQTRSQYWYKNAIWYKTRVVSTGHGVAGP